MSIPNASRSAVHFCPRELSRILKYGLLCGGNIEFNSHLILNFHNLQSEWINVHAKRIHDSLGSRPKLQVDSLAEAYMKSGNLKEAAEYFQKALARDATDQNAKGMLAKPRESKNQ